MTNMKKKETVADLIQEGFDIASNMLQPEEQKERKMILAGAKRLKAAYDNEMKIMDEVGAALIQCELFMSYVCKHAQPRLNPGDECIACKSRKEIQAMLWKTIKLLEKNGFLNLE